jgi:hypothetical protein
VAGDPLARLILVYEYLIRDLAYVAFMVKSLGQRRGPGREWAKVVGRPRMSASVIVAIAVLLNAAFEVGQPLLLIY